MAQAMGAAPRPSWHDRLWALVRRQPHMAEGPVELGQLLAQTLGASLFIVVLPLLMPVRSALALIPLLALATRPFLRAHLAGAHRRWAALAAALAAGLAVGVLVAFVLGGGHGALIAAAWAATVVAAIPYALVTQVD
jgi:hypothetical protein